MDNVIIKKDAVSAVATLCVPQVTHTLLAHNAMVRDILLQNNIYPISFERRRWVIVSVECQNKSLSIVKIFTADRLICIFFYKVISSFNVPTKSKGPTLIRCSNGKRGGFCCYKRYE